MWLSTFYEAGFGNLIMVGFCICIWDFLTMLKLLGCLWFVYVLVFWTCCDLWLTFGPILVTVGQMILRNNFLGENNPALCFRFRCYCLASANTGTGSYRPKLPKTTNKWPIKPPQRFQDSLYLESQDLGQPCEAETHICCPHLPPTVPLPRFIAVFCKEKHPEDTIFSALSYFQNKSLQEILLVTILETKESPASWCAGRALLWIFRNYSPCPTQQDEIAIRPVYWDQILFSLSMLFFASSPQSQNQCSTVLFSSS